MSERNDGGPAFPAFDPYAVHKDAHVMGMSLRDWFAGQALVLMNGNFSDSWGGANDAAKSAYRIADAMMEARK